jgi:hypothetical protein
MSWFVEYVIDLYDLPTYSICSSLHGKEYGKASIYSFILKEKKTKPLLSLLLFLFSAVNIYILVTFGAEILLSKVSTLLVIISSPELKAQVSFSDHSFSGVRLSVRLSVCPSVCKLLHFRLLLQNSWTYFNQI